MPVKARERNMKVPMNSPMKAAASVRRVWWARGVWEGVVVLEEGLWRGRLGGWSLGVRDMVDE